MQGIIEARSRHISDDQILCILKDACKKNGKLSGFIIDEDSNLPSSSVVAKRFGGLLKVYQLIGYTPEVDYSYIEENQRIREQHPQLILEIVHAISELGLEVEHDQDSGLLLINRMFTTSVVLSRCQHTKAGSRRWKIRFDQGLHPDFTIAARMDSENKAIHDYYLLPQIDVHTSQILACQYNGITLDTYRFDTLEYFYNMTRLTNIESIYEH